jgi:hypothetical protein
MLCLNSTATRTLLHDVAQELHNSSTLITDVVNTTYLVTFAGVDHQFGGDVD